MRCRSWGWGEIRAGAAAALTTPGSKPAHWHTDMYAMFDDVQIFNFIDSDTCTCANFSWYQLV